MSATSPMSAGNIGWLEFCFPGSTNLTPISEDVVLFCGVRLLDSGRVEGRFGGTYIPVRVVRAPRCFHAILLLRRVSGGRHYAIRQAGASTRGHWATGPGRLAIH